MTAAHFRFFLLFAALAPASNLLAQQAPSTTDIPYQLPAEILVKLVDAAPTPTLSLSPARGKGPRMLLIQQSSSLPTIADLAQPELRLGEGQQEPNDTYVEQLVDGAKAAIATGAATGSVDPNRVAVMGHSYGAFMTANLLAHSSLFRAGIARSGAYNRSLTPFGFQNEERTYWQAPDVYFKMSPFSYADKIKTPILLFHGEADNNTGTFPIQSERFYNALKGEGATVRFVLLPLESHGYQGRESVLHMLWEMQRWLDKYVKPAQPVTTQSASTGESK